MAAGGWFPRAWCSGLRSLLRRLLDCYELARKGGITVTDEDDELRPDIDRAITCTVTASVWFGITTGYLALTGSYGVPNRLKMYL